uniref:Uncharacterized protein n=1 Tax=Ditylenchus dipsaci TaxID=166011 RepID=A0A915D963_9BILA
MLYGRWTYESPTRRIPESTLRYRIQNLTVKRTNRYDWKNLEVQKTIGEFNWRMKHGASMPSQQKLARRLAVIMGKQRVPSGSIPLTTMCLHLQKNAVKGFCSSQRLQMKAILRMNSPPAKRRRIGLCDITDSLLECQEEESGDPLFCDPFYEETYDFERAISFQRCQAQHQQRRQKNQRQQQQKQQKQQRQQKDQWQQQQKQQKPQRQQKERRTGTTKAPNSDSSEVSDSEISDFSVLSTASQIGVITRHQDEFLPITDAKEIPNSLTMLDIMKAKAIIEDNEPEKSKILDSRPGYVVAKAHCFIGNKVRAVGLPEDYERKARIELEIFVEFVEQPFDNVQQRLLP